MFRLLDQERRKRSIIWLSAPGGAGKTTLIASYIETRRLPVLWYQVDAGDNDVASFFYYLGLAAKAAAPRYKRPMPLLTREYVGALAIFATNYFRELFARLKSPATFVLDNFQELSPDGPMQEVLERGFAEIPAGVNVIVVSREAPPSVFARLRACDKIALFDWEDLKLTPEESAGIVRRRNGALSRSREALSMLYQKTQGWAAGLVLLTEQAERNLSPLHQAVVTGEEVFDYFAAEIFRHAERNVQAFLLKTAFLSKIELPVARALTGEPAAEAILSYLTRRNLFTVCLADGRYEYHPLFRGFLVARAAATYAPEEFRAIKRESARLLAQAGDVENAVALLLQAPGDWAEALGLILERARTLVATGRTETLENWLKAVPEKVRATNPWVLYWLGTCRLAYAPAEARGHFEQAFALFERGEDAVSLYLTWSGIIESFALERNDFTPMRPWLKRYHTLAGRRAGPGWEIETASLTTYVLGLISTAFDHPDLPVCARSVAERVAREPDPERWVMPLVTLIPYYAWRGEMDQLRHALARLGAHAHSPEGRPLAQLSWYTWTCLYAAAIGETEASLKAAKEGFAHANRTGVHVFDTQLLGYGLFGQLCVGNVGIAREMLQQLEPLIGDRRVANAFYSHFASLVLLAEGDRSGAAALARRAAQQARDSGLSLGEMNYSLALAFVLTAHGEVEDAADALREARCLTTAMGSRLFTGFAALCEAYIQRARNVQPPMLAALKQAFEVLRDANIIFPAYLPRQDAAALCAVALEHGIEPEHVRSVISKMQLVAPAGSYPEHWPWPIRIFSLGHFAIHRDGVPLVFRSKAQKKPLALLRALIAFGGHAVPVGKLIESLWPDTDGDTARTTFRSTLHRLRRLVGESVLILGDGVLSLAPEVCWVDTWALEALLENGADPRYRGKRALALYQGAFLEEEEAAWSLIPRERLRARFVHAIIRCGEALALQGAKEEAAELYSQGLERDPLAEPLYRALMQCYWDLHRSADALAVYRRCCTTLRKVLQVEPSPETEALGRAIADRD